MARSVFEASRPPDYLLRLAQSEAGQAYKAMACRELAVEPGDVVLDAGCGPGADLLALAEAVGPGGRVVGVDVDPAMVDAAVARTAGWSQVVVRQGDLHHVDLADGSVDRARTDRVLQHVDDPARVVAELGRVLRSGGRAVLAEPDWDTLVIDHPDLALARRYTRFVADEVFRHGSIGRRLPGLVVRCGLALEKVVPSTVVFRDVEGADRVLGLERVTRRAVAAGALSEREGDGWLAHLAEQPFFAAATLFITVAVKPPDPA